jgi:hypothetical protein
VLIRFDDVKGDMATEGEGEVTSTARVHAPASSSQRDGGRHSLNHVQPYLSDYCVDCSCADLSFELEVKMSSIAEDGDLSDLRRGVSWSL